MVVDPNGVLKNIENIYDKIFVDNGYTFIEYKDVKGFIN
jgi:hypothetical protein